jgi:hypothetical protein
MTLPKDIEEKVKAKIDTLTPVHFQQGNEAAKNMAFDAVLFLYSLLTPSVSQDAESRAKEWVEDRFNGGVSPTTEAHCVAAHLAGVASLQSKLNEAKEDDWVKVEDRLPDHLAFCWIYSNIQAKVFMAMFSQKDNWFQSLSGNYVGIVGSDIDFYQPLIFPKPPKI